MHRAHFYLPFFLVSLSGCLWFLACTPFDFAALAWVAAVPMLLAVDRAPTWRAALLLGWWAGMVETAGGFYWLIETTQRFAGFPWLAGAAVLLVFCAARALIFVIFTALVYGLRRRMRLPMTLLAPLAIAVGELAVPQIFPCGQWITQAWHPLVIQVAELTGPLGVSALLLLVNGALYDLLDAPRRAALPLAAAGLITAAVLVFGAVRMRQVDALIAAAPHLKVGLVQPNFAYPADEEFSRAEALRELDALQTQSRRLQGAGAEFVVWSEGAYPVVLPRDFKADFAPDSPARIRRGLDVPVMIGASTADSLLDDAYNSAILLDADGVVTGRYDKVRLLAFGETIPGIEHFPWLRELLPPGTGRFKPGKGPGIVNLTAPAQGGAGTPWALAPVICYEDLLPGFMRGVGRLHPNLLVNLTSDQWFGAHSEPFEHLALAVFATVELRVGMVRAVNSGVSALIDPNGRVVQSTYADDPYLEPRAADGLLVNAPRMDGGHTPYVRFGNWFAYLCIATLILLGLYAYRYGRPPPNLPGTR